MTETTKTRMTFEELLDGPHTKAWHCFHANAENGLETAAGWNVTDCGMLDAIHDAYGARGCWDSPECADLDLVTSPGFDEALAIVSKWERAVLDWVLEDALSRREKDFDHNGWARRNR